MLLSLVLATSATAQDESVKIVGPLADGTTAPPALTPELPEVEIRETKVVQLPDRKVTIHRIANPGPTHPRPKVPERPEMSPEQIETFRNSPEVQQWLEQAANTAHLYISAMVVDDRATFLSWWHDGAEYQAWSNSDWTILSGFSEFQKGNKRFVSLLMTGRMSSANLPVDSPYRIPDDLLAEPGTYKVTRGDLNNAAAYEGVTALHELYYNDYARLKQA